MEWARDRTQGNVNIESPDPHGQAIGHFHLR